MDKENISSLVRLREAVQEGIDDSDAGRFTSLDLAEALKTHLAALRAADCWWTAEMRQLHAHRAEIAATANLYAKRFADGATGVIVYEHNAKAFPAYEIEVIDADGMTITV